MKDYTKEIEEIANDYNQVPGMIHLVSIIRKDVEAELERLKERINKYESGNRELTAEIERLKEENRELKRPIVQLQSDLIKEMTPGKPDSERLWEAMMSVVASDNFSDLKDPDRRVSLLDVKDRIIKRSNKLIEIWKQATKQ